MLHVITQLHLQVHQYWMMLTLSPAAHGSVLEEDKSDWIKNDEIPLIQIEWMIRTVAGIR